MSEKNSLKTIPFTGAHTYIAHIWQYFPPSHPEGHTIVGVRFKQQKQTNEQTNNTDACFIDIRNTQTFLCNSNKFILKEHHDHLSWSQTKL